ncbi:hypothetical protein ACU4GD_41585 [Cupriavidus basilensis]
MHGSPRRPGIPGHATQDIRETKAGHDAKDGTGHTKHDQGQSGHTLLADTIGHVPVQTVTDMTYAQTAAGGRLNELRTLAASPDCRLAAAGAPRCN